MRTYPPAKTVTNACCFLRNLEHNAPHGSARCAGIRKGFNGRRFHELKLRCAGLITEHHTVQRWPDLKSVPL